MGCMRVLIPVAPGNEEIEFCALLNVLRRADIDVVVASVESGRDVTLQKGLQILAEVSLEDVTTETWDAIVMPGGVPGAMNLGASDVLRTMLQKHHARGGLIGAICLSPALVLEPAGVLKGCDRVTGNPRPIRTPDQSWPADAFTKRLGAAFDAKARVCVDHENKIITSQAPGTAIEYALCIVAMLRGKQTAQDIADYLLVDPSQWSMLF